MKQKKQIAVLGSTGSIGTQTLDVVRQHPDLFEARILTAGVNADKLIEQAREFVPDAVVIADESKYDGVQQALEDLPIKVYAGKQALNDVVTLPSIDIVVAALVGFAGLEPTVNAIKAHKIIALANKETLVVAGELMTRLALEYHAPMIPVDSEHSAIFQSLVGEDGNSIEKILLTASGGPFRNSTMEELASVTPAQALAHPNWNMGAKITIDSATMMNKGFEMIEAKWLFGVKPSDIEIVVHPESLIHSAVQFSDGAIKAQLAMPDMRIPIQYALSFPDRLPLSVERLDLFRFNKMTFTKPDFEKFRCLALAFRAIEQGGNMPCAMNAANEVANLAFRNGRIGFLQIPEIIERVMEQTVFSNEATLEAYIECDRASRLLAESII